MMPSTHEIIRALLKADPSVSVAERSRKLALLRDGPGIPKAETTADRVPRIIRRVEVAKQLSCSLRTVDKLAATGVLQKRKLPGRQRAAGFLESDVNALLAGKESKP